MRIYVYVCKDTPKLNFRLLILPIESSKTLLLFTAFYGFCQVRQQYRVGTQKAALGRLFV